MTRLVQYKRKKYFISRSKYRNSSLKHLINDVWAVFRVLFDELLLHICFASRYVSCLFMSCSSCRWRWDYVSEIAQMIIYECGVTVGREGECVRELPFVLRQTVSKMALSLRFANPSLLTRCSATFFFTHGKRNFYNGSWRHATKFRFTKRWYKIIRGHKNAAPMC
jgi:hypothetical protein